MARYYLTTPIYYVNDLPHIGHIFTTVMADALARYRRLAGDDVRFLTGTDEHGQNIERAAQKDGVTPLALADRVVARYHELWKTFGITHDDFIRTTEPRHERGVHELIRRIEAAGDLYLAKHEGWYCSPCELFYTEKELAPGTKCPVHGSAVEWHSEENVFFRLSKFQRPLLDWIDANPGCIRPETRKNEVRSFVESGLRDLSVSRTELNWGIPFPGYPGHTVYVWLDALANYITALGFGDGQVREEEEVDKEKSTSKSSNKGGRESGAATGGSDGTTSLYRAFRDAPETADTEPVSDVPGETEAKSKSSKKGGSKSGAATGGSGGTTSLYRAFHDAPETAGTELVSDVPGETETTSKSSNKGGSAAGGATGGAGGTTSLYRAFWSAPETAGASTRLHLVGKDILRFHAVYWPAFLMSAGLPLPTTVWAHGWWLRDQKKMSKSVGNVVRPDELVARFGPDALRYFLAREMVFGEDANFSDEAFVDRYNSDLANDLGNSASRLVTLSRSIFDGRTPPTPCEDNQLIAVAREVVADYRASMDELAFQDALRALFRLLAEANQYLVAKEPWKRVKTEGPSEGVSRILWNGLESVRIVATGLLPFMPTMAARVLEAIGAGPAPASLAALAWGGMPCGVTLPELAPIFPRIDKEKFMTETHSPTGVPLPAPAASAAGPAAPAEPAQVSIDQFFATELKVGTVKEAERVPKSDKLIRLMVELGEGSLRQLVAGIGKAYTPEALVGTQVVVVANLKPAKLMGVESRGMVLAATDAAGQPVLVRPHDGVADGTRVK